MFIFSHNKVAWKIYFLIILAWHNYWCILLEIHVTDQPKNVHNYKAEQKGCMVLVMFLQPIKRKKKSEKCGLHSYSSFEIKTF